jgi:hypothetical protein
MDLDMTELHEDLAELTQQREAIEQERDALLCKLAEVEKAWHRTVKLQTLYEHFLAAVHSQNHQAHTHDITPPFTLPSPPTPVYKHTNESRSLTPGTQKYDVYRVLKDAGHPMTARQIYEVLRAEGKTFNYPKPAELVGSVIRASIMRTQRIFTKKDGGIFGLEEWETTAKQNGDFLS